MDLFFIKTDEYAQRYNCNTLTKDEWYRLGHPDHVLGVLCICVGLSLQLVYLPFIITMLQPKFLCMSCYKLMFFLGVMDFTEIICASLITGYLLFHGAVFCTNPTLIYFGGLIGFACWVSSCNICMILTINRCIDIYAPDVSRFLFHGYRTWIWLLIPLAMFFKVMWFEPAICFNSNYLAWFFNPFFGMDDSLHPRSSDGQKFVYASTLHTVNNIVTIIVLCTGNSILCFYVFSSSGTMTRNKKMKRQFIIQVCVICLLVTACSSIYVYMQFFYTPSWLILIGSFSFNLSSGVLAFTYLFLNPTLRTAALDFFCLGKRSVRVDSSSFNNSKTGRSAQQWKDSAMDNNLDNITIT